MDKNIVTLNSGVSFLIIFPIICPDKSLRPTENRFATLFWVLIHQLRITNVEDSPSSHHDCLFKPDCSTKTWDFPECKA